MEDMEFVPLDAAELTEFKREIQRAFRTGMRRSSAHVPNRFCRRRISSGRCTGEGLPPTSPGSTARWSAARS